MLNNYCLSPFVSLDFFLLNSTYFPQNERHAVSGSSLQRTISSQLFLKKNHFERLIKRSGLLVTLADTEDITSHRKFEKIYGDKDEDDGGGKYVNKTLRTQELAKKL